MINKVEALGIKAKGDIGHWSQAYWKSSNTNKAKKKRTAKWVKN